MMPFLSRILSYPRTTLAAVLFLGAFFAAQALTVSMDNSLEAWLPRDSAARLQYDRFVKDFGSEEFILIAFSLPKGLTRAHLTETARLTAKLSQVPGVDRVWSLNNIFESPRRHFETFTTIVPQSDFCQKLLISPDQRASAIMVELSPEGLKHRRQTVTAIRELVHPQPMGSPDIYLAGPPVISTELDALAGDAARRLYPLLAAVCLIMLFCWSRCTAGVVVPAAMMALSVVMVVGWAGILDTALNAVSIAALPLIMVLALAYALYGYTAYTNELSKGSGDKHAAVSAAFCAVALPVLLSALTTAAGFASLWVSKLSPVRELGLFVVLGIGSTLVLAATLIPAALVCLPAPEQKPGRSGALQAVCSRLLPRLGHAAVHWRRLILAFSLAGVVLSGFSISRLEPETFVLHLFEEDSRIRTAYRFIENHLSGLSPVEIGIALPEPAARTRALPAALRLKIRQLQNELDRHDLITGSVSVDSLLRERRRLEMLDLLFIPKDRMYAAIDRAAAAFLSVDGSTTRITLYAKTVTAEDYLGLVRFIDSRLRHIFPDTPAYVTGAVPLIVEMQERLVTDLIKSFLTAFAVIFLIFLILLRSLKLSVICMISNLLPVVAVLGMMGGLGIPLDVATMMIASITIGIAVDDTLHFIINFREEARRSTGFKTALQSTLAYTGKAMVSSSAVIICGFLVLMFSGFVPMKHFGLLTAIAVMAALAADLLLLPAMLFWHRVPFYRSIRRFLS